MLSLAKASQWNSKIISCTLRHISIYHRNTFILRNAVYFYEKFDLLKQGIWNRNFRLKNISRNFPKLSDSSFDRRNYTNFSSLQNSSITIDSFKKILLSNLKDLLQSFLTSPSTSHIGFSFERHGNSVQRNKKILLINFFFVCVSK
jgi:hypothetical protein